MYLYIYIEIYIYSIYIYIYIQIHIFRFIYIYVYFLRLACFLFHHIPGLGLAGNGLPGMPGVPGMGMPGAKGSCWSSVMGRIHPGRLTAGTCSHDGLVQMIFRISIGWFFFGSSRYSSGAFFAELCWNCLQLYLLKPVAFLWRFEFLYPGHQSISWIQSARFK